MSTDFDAQVHSLDRAILTPLVQAALDNSLAVVLGWTVQPLTGFSAVGYLFRLRGTAQVQSDMLDWSLILKIVPSSTSSQVRFGFLSDEPSHVGYWKREMLFYRSPLYNQLPDGLTTPRCFGASENEDSCWLWLEDIQESQEWSLATFALAAKRFGQLNGRYAVEGRIPPWPWLATDDGFAHLLVQMGFVTDESFHQIADLSRQHAIVRRAWPEDVLDGMRLLWDEREGFFGLLRGLPKTLVHGDVARKNLFARPRAQASDDIVAIDWGLLGIAPLGQEIAGLTVHTIASLYLPTNQLEELDAYVFDGYLQGLSDGGWKGDPRIVRLGYAARTAIHFSLNHIVRRQEMSFLEEEKRKQTEADTGLSMDEYLHMLATVRRFILDRAEEAQELQSTLHL